MNIRYLLVPRAHSATSVKKRGWQKGVAIIEMALVLPLLLLLVFGIIEYGVALYNKAVITNITREAVRNAILYRVTPISAATVKTDAESRCQGRVVSFRTASCTATVTFPSPVVTGATATVSLSYNYSGFFAYKSTSPIVATTQMNFE